MTAHVRRRGDPAEPFSEPDLERLYEQFHPFVRAALRKHYVDPRDLEDMTQEVFLVLLRRVDDASRTPSIGAWLHQIARRVAANHHRGDRRRVRKHGELEAEADTAVRDTMDLQERYARAEAWAFVREFLESLDAEACAVFVMSEIEGLRGAEIAARLRISLPMTYARIRTVRARFALRVARQRRSMLAGLWWACERPALAVLAVAMTTSRRLKLALAAVVLALFGFLSLHGGDDDAREGGASARVEDGPAGSQRHAARARDAASDESNPRVGATDVFAGIVVDVGGAAIAGAIVCGDRTNAPDHPLTSPPTCVTSDAHGRFRIDGILRRAHTLEAMARGFVPGRFHGRPGKDIRIVLHPGGVELSGVVADVHGGVIEGAWVALEIRDEATLGAAVTTDEAGAFSLWVAEGPVSLASGASGYATSFRPSLAPARGVQIELGAESVIAGIVVDEHGDPVADVRVGALLQEGTENYANRGGVAVSDVDGRWEIHGLAPDEYIVDAASERGWGRAEEAVELGIGDVRNGIRIELMAGVEIVGRIVDADSGNPCSDGTAITLDPAQSITREDQADGDGWVAVGPLTGGAVYRVTASCRGYESRELEVDLRDGPALPVEWALAPGGELKVRVVDGAGAPLPDWNVELATPIERDVSYAYDRLGHFATDAEGRVVFSGVSVGEYRVIAQGPGHPPIAREHVAVGSTRAEIELRATAGVVITGTVVDDQGIPVAGALVALQRPGKGTRVPHPYWSADVEVDSLGQAGPYHAITDAAGEFRFASVGRGEYGVWLLPEEAALAYQQPGEYPRGTSARVSGKPHRSITVGERPLALVLRMGTMSSISGIVRGEDGDVLMDTRVFAVREHRGGALEPRGRPRLSDREGRYTIDGLEAGTYTMIAYGPGGGIVRRSGIAAGSRDVDLELPRTGRISGTVRASDGSVVKAFTLHVHSAQRYDRPPFPAGSKDGHFAVSGLEAGRYSVWVTTPKGEGKAEVELDDGERREGVVITVAGVTASVTGRLVGTNGAPATGWLVAWREPGDDEHGRRWISKPDEDGTFAFRRLPPWRFAIVAFPEVAEMEDPQIAAALVHDAPELRVITLKEGEAIDLGDLMIDDGAN